MAKKKLIDRELLHSFHQIMEIALSKMKQHEDRKVLEDLISQYKKFILEEDAETINQIKRNVYLKMKATKDPAENKKLYELYTSLKEYTNLDSEKNMK